MVRKKLTCNKLYWFDLIQPANREGWSAGSSDRRGRGRPLNAYTLLGPGKGGEQPWGHLSLLGRPGSCAAETEQH